MNVYVYIIGTEREGTERYSGEGEARVQKEETAFGDFSLAPRCARSINHSQGKKFAVQILCDSPWSPRLVFIASSRSRVRGGHCRHREGKQSRKKRKGRKAREALLDVIVMYRFSKSFYPVLLPSSSFLFLLSATSLSIIVCLFRCFFVSFGMKNIVYTAVGV